MNIDHHKDDTLMQAWGEISVYLVFPDALCYVTHLYANIAFLNMVSSTTSFDPVSGRI